MAAERTRLRFPAEARLRRAADFRRVLDEGLRVSDAVLTLWVARRTMADGANSPTEGDARGGPAGEKADATDDRGSAADARGGLSTPLGAFSAPLCTRIGIRTGRRLGNSPQRSRLRRVIREAFRLSRPLLPAGLDVVCSPRSRAGVTLASCRASLESLLSRAGRRLRT
ncbi:MAG: ribonuclease P protein component [Phycisphaerales bacterium]|nr:ribonuclease P protein component [Phycisphaerales bacterium]